MLGANDYGFLSDFNLTEDEARERVRRLFFNHGIAHFQFYDCMERYEKPFDFNKDEWRDPLGRKIRRVALEAYLDEINKLGAKSWLYIGVYSVSLNYCVPGLENALFTFIPEKQEFVQEWLCVDDNPQQPLVSVINPSSLRWKQYFTDQLRTAVSQFGFFGIQFDQYGSLDVRFRFRYRPTQWSWGDIRNPACFEEIDKRKLIADFLEYFKEHVPGVPFTFNAVDGYGLEETGHLVDFSFVELWDEGVLTEYCRRFSATKRKFVIVMYTPFKDGKFDWEAFERRKEIVNNVGGTFLYQGDDNRYLINCYFPAAIKISES